MRRLPVTRTGKMERNVDRGGTEDHSYVDSVRGRADVVHGGAPSAGECCGCAIRVTFSGLDLG